MPLRQRSVATALLGAAVLCAVGSLLVGCTETGGTPSSSASPSAQTLDEPNTEPPMNTSEFGGEAAPAPTDGSEVVVPTQSADNGPRASELTTLEVGDEDYSDLDWRVSCSGLDANPTIIASATDGDLHLTLVLLGSSPTSLSSLMLSSGEAGGSSHTNTGLTVNPGAGQGSGSLDVESSTLSSTGRGLEFGPDAAGTNADTIYSFSVTCASA